MTRLDPTTGRVLTGLATDVRRARLAMGLSQARLARELGVSQSTVARLERARLPNLSIRQAVKAIDQLGGEFEVRVGFPARDPIVRDAAHARCASYVAGRLKGLGHTVATEVEVGSGTGRGVIDVMAFHPVSGTVLAFEVKTELVDLGELERQIRRHALGAMGAGAALGWKARHVQIACLLLATELNDTRLVEHRGLFDRLFPVRWSEIRVAIGDRTIGPAHGWGLAMIDPRARRSQWLLPTRIDGRRRPARYRDRLDYLASARRQRLDSSR